MVLRVRSWCVGTKQAVNEQWYAREIPNLERDLAQQQTPMLQVYAQRQDEAGVAALLATLKPLAEQHRGKLLFVVRDRTVAKTDSVCTLDPPGLCWPGMVGSFFGAEGGIFWFF